MARILIAEDDPDLCWIWSETLTDANHVVSVAHDGRQAARALESMTFDILIADVIMPVNGAIVLAALARLCQADIGIIAVTGCLALSDTPIEDAVAGADRALRKPIDLDQLCRTVAELEPPKAA